MPMFASPGAPPSRANWNTGTPYERTPSSAGGFLTRELSQRISPPGSTPGPYDR